MGTIILCGIGFIILVFVIGCLDSIAKRREWERYAEDIPRGDMEYHKPRD